MEEIIFKDKQVNNAWKRIVANKYGERFCFISNGISSIPETTSQANEIKDLRLVLMALVKQVGNGLIL